MELDLHRIPCRRHRHQSWSCFWDPPRLAKIGI
jgi:hypothetical protein